MNRKTLIVAVALSAAFIACVIYAIRGGQDRVAEARQSNRKARNVLAPEPKENIDHNVGEVNGGISVQAALSGGGAKPEGLTIASLGARVREAERKIRTQDKESALRDLLTCLNDSFTPGIHPGIRWVIVKDLVELSQSFAPALASLLEYREASAELMTKNQKDHDAASLLATINRRLGDDEANLKTFDSFPKQDPRRPIFGVQVFPTLVEAGRYSDALEAKGFNNMLAEVEHAQRTIKTTSETGRINNLVEAAQNVEVLAGANKLDEAAVIINRGLSLDSSDNNRRLLSAAVQRAGHSPQEFSGL